LVGLENGIVGLHDVWKKNGRKYKTVNYVVKYVDGTVGIYQNVGN
jgi:hypothetical protein